MKVEIGEKIKTEIINWPLEDKAKIRLFIDHVEVYGFTGLQGKNKNSDEVPKDDPNWLSKVKKAQNHNLWHYHIGIPCYYDDNKISDKTSEYVLHYIKGEGVIKIVDFSAHPPFALPRPEYLV